jgi:hypothetical protein
MPIATPSLTMRKESPMKRGKNWWESGALWGGLMLFFGGGSTIFNKVQYSIVSHGTEWCKVDGVRTLECSFQKPYWLVFQMKFGMAFCLVVHYFLRRKQKQDACDSPEPLLGKGKGGEDDDNVSGPVSWRTLLMINAPASLDLLQSVICNVGFLFTAPSIYQMTRGSVVFFSAFLSKTLLKKRLQSVHYVSVAIVVLAITLVGVAALKMQADDSSDDDGSSSSGGGKQLIGIFMIVLSQVFCALQIVVEEHFLTTLKVSPVLLVGMEGFWGLSYFIVLLPILAATPVPEIGSAIGQIYHEDTGDTLTKIGNSGTLQLVMVLYIIFIGSYNLFGNFVTKYLNAVMRSMLEASRTIVVWVFDLMAFYALTNWSSDDGNPGEEWVSWSWLQLGGFCVLMFGTFSYKGLIQLPCLAPLEDDAPEEELEGDKEQAYDPLLNGDHAT